MSLMIHRRGGRGGRGTLQEEATAVWLIEFKSDTSQPPRGDRAAHIID